MFIAFTSKFTTLVWMGDDKKERALGKSDAAYMTVVPLWARYMYEAAKSYPNPEIPWVVPPGVKPEDRGDTKFNELTPRLGPIESIGPNVGVLVDGFHLYAANESAESAPVWGVDKVVWVHIADLPRGADPDRSVIIDADRGFPGEHGAIDSAGLLKALEDAGYEGPVTVEPLARCRSLSQLSPESKAKAAAVALRAVWPTQVP